MVLSVGLVTVSGAGAALASTKTKPGSTDSLMVVGMQCGPREFPCVVAQ